LALLCLSQHHLPHRRDRGGEELVRYSNIKPKSGRYEIVPARRAIEP
jgi:hypothetical protein